MSDLIVDSEEYFAARGAADLLARVRAGCCYTLTETPARDGWPEFESQLSLTGPPELMRELAEALTVGGDSGGKSV